MSCNATTEAGAILKTDRSKLEKIVVLAFKPPFVDPTTKTPYIVFITAAGNETRLPAVPDLWRFIDGAPRPGKRSASLTTDTRRKFVLYVTRGVGNSRTAVSVTNYPHEDFLYTAAFGAPEKDTEDVHFLVHPTTGSLTLESVPTGVKLQQLMNLVAAIDAGTRIEAGNQLGGDSEILSVNGLRFTASVAVVAPSASGQVMV